MDKIYRGPGTTVLLFVNTVLGGGSVWTPGRGLKKVPPRSPLLNIIERIGEMETLQNIEQSPVYNMDDVTMAQLTKIKDSITAIIENRSQVKIPKEYRGDHHHS